MSELRSANRYMMTVIILGAVCLIAAVFSLPIERADVYLPVLAALTVIVGSRVTIQIPRFKSHVAVSDTFIFLTLMLYGGEFAIILSAVEAFVSSWRFCNRKITVFFNASAVAISTTLVFSFLKGAGLYSPEQLHGQAGSFTNFVIVLSVMAMGQFAVNTSLAAIYDSLKSALPLWETWKSKYIWTFFSYFVGAIGAGVLIQLSDSAGIGIIFATFPVIFFVFLSYRMYMKNIEISIQQAEQAEQYANILESQSEALRESEERFRSAFDHAPIGIGLLSPTGSWLKVNQALSDILGYAEKDFLAMDFQAITLPDDLGKTLVKIHELLSGKIASCQMEQRYIHKTGRVVWTSWSVSAAHDSTSKQPNLIFQLQDITDRKSAEQKLQHEATHDVLTGLPNRLYFMNKLTAALDRTRSIEGYKASVLFIDLDRFKYVNDSLGHVIGDQLLRCIAERLGECMRPADTVARLGGDEFTILVEGKYDTAEVLHIADRIQEKFSVPFDLSGHEVYSTASIGILHASKNHQSSEDMMRDADIAMYQAKRAGKARHEVFDEAMHSIVKETLRLETDLRRAVERDEIQVYYQPIYDLATGRIESVESLARWYHPEFGPISPSKFIPLAEEIGLIDNLCAQVLKRACGDIGTLSLVEKLPVSVNLSCRQFSQTKLVGSIHDILDETGFSPKDLRLEITESVFFEHQERAVETLNDLRNSGIEINIDDFGTGYSNLGYLQKLPVSALKIDRTFVSMIDADGNNDDIVRAIITLARNFGLKVVAEGIETDAQLNVLRGLECEGGQGYLFAAPMSIDKLVEFMAENEPAFASHSAFENVPEASLIQ
ncbi:MAG: EAL domain-containing protein [Chloracidobacterium sp.]|nr:EAL domain-containing protein [Chloracidobacterium sp.]